MSHRALHHGFAKKAAPANRGGQCGRAVIDIALWPKMRRRTMRSVGRNRPRRQQGRLRRRPLVQGRRSGWASR